MNWRYNTECCLVNELELVAELNSETWIEGLLVEVICVWLQLISKLAFITWLML